MSGTPTLLPIIFLLLQAPVARAMDGYTPCLLDPVKQAQRSAELRQLEEADQADRPHGGLSPGAEARDRGRRERIGAIFGEGCLKSGDDYANAALVFQHGGDLYSEKSGSALRAQAADQLLQAFLWAKRATELGHDSKWLAAAAADRYLWYTGHKQLFGTQGFKVNLSDRCWCIIPIEATFPDARRLEYTRLTQAQALEHAKQLPGEAADCKPAYCELDLAPSPAGALPGFW